MPYNKSDYKFTDPIRYFKENDPYYWEVDNIPLKQLQENILWLKDQVAPEDAIDSEGNPTLNLDRANFKELRPFVNQTDNVVYVNPGRFIGRVNDAYNIIPLQSLAVTNGSLAVGAYATFSGVNSQALLDYLYEALQDKYSPSLNLNGLIERVTYWDYETVTKDIIDFIDGIPNPNQDAETPDLLWPLIQTSKFYVDFTSSIYRNSQALANEFVRMYRGVARTAVVDVPYQLSIEIPAFDAADFSYIDENGRTQLVQNAATRIDLLFVYTKPVDSSYTSVGQWKNSTPTTITTPVLGIVKGAGVGLRNKQTTTSYGETYNAVDENQNTGILAHIADKLNTNNGFKALNVHGSFPSPDDLMNLAPIITTRIQQNDPRLIGQSVLPLAYIVVNGEAELNSAGNPVIYNKDIIDIRPFFRTAELTYNERAGIAAAIPAPSLSNPVATEYTVENAIQKVKSYADSKFVPIDYNVGLKYDIIAAGTIYGGTVVGPEASLTDIFETASPAWAYRPEFSLAGVGVPATPDWDKAAWARNSGSNLATNRISYARISAATTLDDGNIPAIATTDNAGNANCLIFSKKIIITNLKNRFNWVRAYDVDLSFQNCVPLASIPNAPTGREDGGWAGVWVVKNPNVDVTTGNGTLEFTIFVAVPRSRTYYELATSGGIGATPDIIDNSAYFNSFLVIAPQTTSTGVGDTNAATNKIGTCMYPSVSWKVTAFGGGSYTGGTPGDNGSVISF
jgi:hypothetical protein